MTRRRPGWEDEIPMEDMEAGALSMLSWWRSWEQPAPDVSDVLVGRLPDAPHLITIWEPLRTKAPSPPRCMPFCCYSRSVIFYHRPYIKAPPHPYYRGGRDYGWTQGGFADFDQIETRVGSGDIVEFDGDRFEVGGGHVCWSKSRPGGHRRWWMRFWARRQAEVTRIGERTA